MLGYANFIAGMRRIVIGEEKEKENLLKMLMLKEKEEFYTLKEFNKKGLRLEPNGILLFFTKPEELANVKNIWKPAVAQKVFISSTAIFYSTVTAVRMPGYCGSRE